MTSERGDGKVAKYSVRCRLKSGDVSYIFDFAEVDSIIVDQEYLPLLDDFKKTHPNVRLIIDLVRTLGRGFISFISILTPYSRTRTPRKALARVLLMRLL